MFWLQGGLSFLLWIAYGVIQSRRSHTIRAQVSQLSRARRGITGAALLVVGAMVLIGGLGIVLMQGGFARGGLTPLAWLIVFVLGLAFVHAQTMGTAMLISLIQDNVTNEGRGASIKGADRDQVES